MNVLGINHYFQQVYQPVVEEPGKLGGHFVWAWNQNLREIRENPRLAGWVTAVSAVVIADLTSRILELIYRKFFTPLSAENNKTIKLTDKESAVVIGIGSLMIIGLNVIFFRNFQPSLTPAKAAMIVIAGTLSQVIIQLLLVNKARIGKTLFHKGDAD